MESEHPGVPGQERVAVITEEDDSSELCHPGIEEYITSEMVLGLLGIPETGLLRISAALLIAGNNELCAYWWRDQYSGQQRAELRDPVLVRAAFSTVAIDSGYLPPNVLRLGLNEGVQWMAVYVPPAPYQLALVDGGERAQVIRVELPGMVLAGRGNQYWIWAVKERDITANTPVFHVPLPNVGADGTMCFGSNAAPVVGGPTILQALHLFLDSPFNNHWAMGKSRVHPGDIRDRLRAIAELDTSVFPEDELLPITPTNALQHELTLDHLLQHIMRR